MTLDQFQQPIADVQQHQSELANVEVKAARAVRPDGCINRSGFR